MVSLSKFKDSGSVTRPLTAQAIASHYGGRAIGETAKIPTIGHSKDDDGTAITVDPSAPDGVLVHVHNASGSQEAAAFAVKDMLRNDCFLDQFNPSKRSSVPQRPVSPAPQNAANDSAPVSVPAATVKKTLEPSEFDESKLIYDYKNLDGGISYRVERVNKPEGEKQFYFKHRGADGDWVLERGGDAIFYRWPEIYIAPKDAIIFMAEGQLKADKIASWGYSATSLKDLPKDMKDTVEGRTFAILPDNDDVGAELAIKAAEKLKAAGAASFEVVLPGLPEKGDILDWVGTAEELEALTLEAQSKAGAVSEDEHPDDGQSEKTIPPKKQAVPKKHRFVEHSANEEPQWLVDLGRNPMAEYVRKVVGASFVPQPWLALGSAIAVFGTLAGRRYATELDSRTNFYNLLVLDSGMGKDTPFKGVHKVIFEALGSESGLLNGWPHSDSAIEETLTHSNPALFAKDEISEHISQALNPKSQGHVKAIMNALTEMYSAANSVYTPRAYAAREYTRKNIHQPHLCVLGACTPSALFGQALAPEHFATGALPRFMIFEGNTKAERVRGRIDTRLKFSEELLDCARELRDGPESHPVLDKGQGVPFTVWMTDEAYGFQQQRGDDLHTQSLSLDSGQGPILRRINEQALKLALLKAVTDDPQDPEIKKSDIEWGHSVIEATSDTLLDAFRNQVSSSENDAAGQDIRKAILSKEGGPKTRTQLNRVVSKVGSRKFNEITQEFEEQGLLSITITENTGGRPLRTYEWIGN